MSVWDLVVLDDLIGHLLEPVPQMLALVLDLTGWGVEAAEVAEGAEGAEGADTTGR